MDEGMLVGDGGGKEIERRQEKSRREEGFI
jgi:hypothetical protein